MKKHITLAVITALAALLAGCATNKKVAPNTKALGPSAQISASTLTDPTSLPSWSWEAWCESEWDQSCEGFQRLDLPDGWDICSVQLGEMSLSHGEWRLAEVRKNGITIWLKSWGSHAFFDRWGGWVRVSARIYAVPSAWTPEQRKQYGCEKPVPGGLPTGKGMDTFCLKKPGDAGAGTLMCRNWEMTGSEKRYLDDWHPCGVCYSDALGVKQTK